MKHILFIDELEKLDIKKDSSLLLAIALQEAGHETYIMFKSDFFYHNRMVPTFNLFSFRGVCFSDSSYIEKFNLEKNKKVQLNVGDTVHMRLDPPFDSKYLRYLWMLQGIEKKGIRVINSPAGIMNHNEKLYAYEQESSLMSFVGESKDSFVDFIKEVKEKGVTEIVMKPLDLYQGIGVQKFSIESTGLEIQFDKKVADYKGPVVVQPFDSQVKKGEVRTIYYKGVELGSILKTPASDNFLANIASGASYKSATLTQNQKTLCDRISTDLMVKEVDWIAFDLLGDAVSEVNITCPGLLVEVAEACKNNLVSKLVSLMTNRNL